MQTKRKIGVLKSEYVPLTVTVSAVSNAIQKIDGIDAIVRQIDTDCLDNDSLSEIDVLINCLGAYYPQTGWQYLSQYYKEGGILLNVGYKPFTVPYRVKENKPEIFPESAQAFHELYVVDEYESTGPVDLNNFTAKLPDARYAFIKEMIASSELPNMLETSSIYYHFTEDWIPKEPGFAEFVDAVNVVSARAEIALVCDDATGRRMAAPISRIDHFERGSLIFLNFTPEEPDYYATESGCKLLSGMIQTALDPQVAFRIRPSYPRYFENENPEINFNCKLLDHSPITNQSDWHVQFKLYQEDNDEPLQTKEMRFQLSDDKNWQDNFMLTNLHEGFYRIEASLYYGDRLIHQQSNGFYKLSNHAIKDKLSGFSPLEFDPEIAPDFMIRDGKPFAMHGTTYFVTDVFRTFLFDFNCHQCHEDLSFLKSVGFNILRTGNWYQFDRFFEEDGPVCEYSLRTLEAFFLLAATYDFPIQFVLSAFVFNHWNRRQSPVHHPEARKKTVKAFGSFAKRFAGYPNVQIDGLNEPSYSYLGMWQNARPTGDPSEREQFVRYLKQKYDDIETLREVWNMTSSRLPDFDAIQLPDPDQFSRGYDIKKQPYMEHAMLNDFFQFARESYSDWVREIWEEIRKYDTEMPFMMGRDEPLRIPEQQTEVYHGNFDMTNWHHWHQDAVIFSEYALNRVRGVPCCGQEIGVYHFSDPRNHLRFDEESRSNIMERKLVYSFGNWIQWQSYCDPFMQWNVEIALGLLRYDKTETSYMDRVRLLTWIEEKTAPLMCKRDEDNAGILLVHPSSYYYSVDHSIAKRAAHQSTLALHYHNNFQADVILEHLLTEKTLKQYSKTKLIIFPAGMIVSNATWKVLSKFIKSGGTVLFSGVINQDEYWRFNNRLAEFDASVEIKPISPYEKVKIGDQTFSIPFYECVDRMLPETAVSKMVYSKESENKIQVLSLGKGKLIHCPVPVEIGDNLNAIASLYQFGIEQADVSHSHCQVKSNEPQPHIMVYPIAYENCTCYTIVNEGPDDIVKFTDLKSNAEIQLHVHSGRSSKIWINHDGTLAGAYVHGALRINDKVIESNGDLSLFKSEDQYQLIPGNRDLNFVQFFEAKVKVMKNQEFNVMYI